MHFLNRKSLKFSYFTVIETQVINLSWYLLLAQIKVFLWSYCGNKLKYPEKNKPACLQSISHPHAKILNPWCIGERPEHQQVSQTTQICLKQRDKKDKCPSCQGPRLLQHYNNYFVVLLPVKDAKMGRDLCMINVLICMHEHQKLDKRTSKVFDFVVLFHCCPPPPRINHLTDFNTCSENDIHVCAFDYLNISSFVFLNSRNFEWIMKHMVMQGNLHETRNTEAAYKCGVCS